jgi:hypothetical protein
LPNRDALVDDGGGRVRTVLGVETQAETPCLVTATERISQRLLRRGATDVCPGFAAKGLWNRVFLPVFELPDEGYLGYLRGRTANVSPKNLGLEEYAAPIRVTLPEWLCSSFHPLDPVSIGQFPRGELERCVS